MWYSIAIKKAALIINIMAIVQLFNTELGDDPIMNIIIFQKTLDIGFVMTGMFHNLTDFEKTLIKIQKVFRLLDIPQEDLTQDRHPDEKWPTAGKLEIKGAKLRYRPTTDIVLKGLNVKIKGGEKVGVVGRTGAGKSTLAMSLTRIVDICAGNIFVDGVDINKINLQ